MAGDTISKGLNFKVFTGRLPRIPSFGEWNLQHHIPACFFQSLLLKILVGTQIGVLSNSIEIDFSSSGSETNCKRSQIEFTNT
jgi:hypothetical protein